MSFPPVILQAGGKGERMRAGGQVTPKVLTPVAGVALLERLVRQLADEGARRFHIILGHDAPIVEAHLHAIKGLPEKISFDFVREHEARGNVGALSELADIGETVLFAFGDLLTDLRFATLLALHRASSSDLTAASHIETHQIQLGQLIVEGDRITGYREKPAYDFLICSGIMAIEPRVLRLLPPDGAMGMSAMVMMAVEAGMKVTHWRHGAFWMDVNTPALLAQAEQELAR